MIGTDQRTKKFDWRVPEVICQMEEDLMKILRLTFRPYMNPDETWVGCRKRTAQSIVTKELEEDGCAAADRKNCE